MGSSPHPAPYHDALPAFQCLAQGAPAAVEATHRALGRRGARQPPVLLAPGHPQPVPASAGSGRRHGHAGPSGLHAPSGRRHQHPGPHPAPRAQARAGLCVA